MSGWRAKLGVISIVGDSFEAYIHSRLPEGVSLISSKIPYKYSNKDLSAAFRVFSEYKTDTILFAGRENAEELEAALNNEGIKIGPQIITKRDILETYFSSGNDINNILWITPYDDGEKLSDSQWLSQKYRVITKIIPLLGVRDEGLTLDDATDYWKYHRAFDAIKSTENEEYDIAYIEDIELGFADLTSQLGSAFNRQIVSTQEILLRAAFKSCGIGYSEGGNHAEL